MDKFLPREEYFEQGLYMFDIGQNDLAGAFYSKSEDEVIASIPTILIEFEEGIKVIGFFPLNYNFNTSEKSKCMQT